MPIVCVKDRAVTYVLEDREEVDAGREERIAFLHDVAFAGITHMFPLQKLHTIISIGSL